LQCWKKRKRSQGMLTRMSLEIHRPCDCRAV
jgi:hypothetical protein